MSVTEKPTAEEFENHRRDLEWINTIPANHFGDALEQFEQRNAKVLAWYCERFREAVQAELEKRRG